MDHHGHQQLIEEFRANGGRLGGAYRGRRVLLLTTTAAATATRDGDGDRRTTPLVYLPDHRPDAEARMLVIASGAADGWYADLRAEPQATVEAGTWTFTVKADLVDGAERDRLFVQAAEADPDLAAAQAAADEPIPVVALTPVGGGPPSGPLGETLMAVHQGFRDELAVLREEIGAAAAGPGPGLVLQLRVNCLTLCQGLEFHHTGEDQQMFSSLEENHPELARTLARLRREHSVVADILDRLRALVGVGVGVEGAGDGGRSAPEPGAVLAEVDRLVAELEAHLDYEEEQLVPVLNEIVL